MKFYICNIYFNDVFNNIHSVISEIASNKNELQSLTKLEYLKIYLNTDRGKNNINLRDNLGWTPLMIASFYAHTPIVIEIVKLLIQNGANINFEDIFASTSFMKISQYSNRYIPPAFIFEYQSSIEASSIEVVQLLIESGVNINSQSINGNTALMYVCEKLNKTSSTAKLLIENGANIDLQNNKGETALMIAIRCSKTNNSTIKLLIESGANINLQNNKGNTALIIAVKYLDIETVKLLIDNLRLKSK